MERPAIENMKGTWECFKWIHSSGEEVTRQKFPEANFTEWTLYEDGRAEYFGIRGYTRQSDIIERKWGLSEKPDENGHYLFLINDQPNAVITSLTNQELIMTLVSNKFVHYFKRI